MNWNMNSGWGKFFLNSFPSLGGKVFIVCKSTDASYDMIADIVKYDPDGDIRLFTDLEAAYSATTNNSNDVIYLFGIGGQTLTGTLTWSNSHVHLVGVCAPTTIFKRARIFMTAGVADTPMLDLTGSSCMFKNFYMNHGVNQAAALIALNMTGDRNYFEGVHIAGIGNDSQDAAGAASLKLDASHENYFKDCYFGTSSVDAGSAANSELLFDGSSSMNTFRGCTFFRRIEHDTQHPLIKIADPTGIDGYTLFEDCNFIYRSTSLAYHGTAPFKFASAPTKGEILLRNCAAFSGNATEVTWDADNRGVVKVTMATAAGSGAGGLATNI